MSSASSPLSTTPGWLLGRAPDLLLGCGGLYLAVIALYSSYGAELRAAHPAYFPHILILLVSAPHYGGTLLRVYEAAEDRERYRSFALGLTAAVVAAMLVATHSVAFASVLATVYLTWSPWHYTAQNYGLASMFLGRRGVTAPPGVKKLLRASFILSYALIFVVMHGATGGGYRDPFGIHGSSVAFLPLGIPEALAQLVLPVLVVAYLGVATAALIGMRRHAPRLASLGPTLMLMALQGVWFSIPMLVRFYPWNTGLEPFDLQARVIDYALFLAFGHSAQYLWVTSYFARKSGSWSGYGSYFLKVAASGMAIWTLPTLLMAPGRLGGLSFDAGLGLVVASGVNLHHFILDGTIWKLRDARVAAVLIRSEDGTVTASRGSWLRRGMWAVGLLGMGLYVGTFWIERVAIPHALERVNHHQLGRLLDRLRWVGADRAVWRTTLATEFAKAGNPRAAAAQLRRALELNPDPAVYLQLAGIEQRLGRSDDAIAALEGALAAGAAETAPIHARLGSLYLSTGDDAKAVAELRQGDPDSPSTAARLAWVLATTEVAGLRDPLQALALTARAEGDPDAEGSVADAGALLDARAAALASLGRFREAEAAALRAAAAARAAGHVRLARGIERRARSYATGRMAPRPPFTAY